MLKLSHSKSDRSAMSFSFLGALDQRKEEEGRGDDHGEERENDDESGSTKRENITRPTRNTLRESKISHTKMIETGDLS